MATNKETSTPDRALESLGRLAGCALRDETGGSLSCRRSALVVSTIHSIESGRVSNQLIPSG
jgi:hypothetical protein